MLKKSITYEDFDGNEVTEDYYFHLSKAELIEMEMSHKGGFEKYLTGIVKAEDGAKIIAEYKKLVLMTYGQKSEDGKRFVKTQELRDDFEATEAYSQLFMELCTNAELAAEFVNGVIPRGLAENIAKLRESQEDTAPTHRESRMHPEAETVVGAPVSSGNFTETAPETRTLTQAEARDMDPDELKSGLVTGRYRIPSGPDAYKLS